MCDHILEAINHRHFGTPLYDDAYWRQVLALSPGERAIILAFRFSEEVHNGGFDQFFTNGGFRYAHETAEGLERLGFRDMAAFLRRAIEMAQIPNPVSGDYDYLINEPECGMDTLMSQLSALFDEFFDAHTNKDWDEKLLGYVQTHPNEFV